MLFTLCPTFGVHFIENKNEISAYLKKKPKIYVTDSTGRKYYSKLPNTVEYYMNKPNDEIVFTD